MYTPSPPVNGAMALWRIPARLLALGAPGTLVGRTARGFCTSPGSIVLLPGQKQASCALPRAGLSMEYSR